MLFRSVSQSRYTVYNAGALTIYLNHCLYAYMVRAGIVVGDTSLALNFAKYRVPTLVAVAFQHCAPYEDKKLGNTVTMKFPAFDYSFISTQVVSESVHNSWVSTGTVSSLAGENQFGEGNSVTSADFTESEWSALSDWIGAGFETVPVSEIGLKAPTHYGLVHRGSTMRSIKPIIGNLAFYSISSCSDLLGPYTSWYPIVEVDNSLMGGAYYDNVLWGYGLWSTSHLKYSPGLGFGIVYKRQKVNPLMANFKFYSQSIPKMVLNILDFMVQIGMLSLSSSFNGNACAFMLYQLCASYGRALASAPAFCHHNGITSQLIPQYSSPLLLKTKVPIYESSRGYEPTRSHDAIICPWFVPQQVAY